MTSGSSGIEDGNTPSEVVVMDEMSAREAAEARMNAAREELLTYVEGRRPLDRDKYGRLVQKVKHAEAEFMRAVSG